LKLGAKACRLKAALGVSLALDRRLLEDERAKVGG
jgi:hypothetical protein